MSLVSELEKRTGRKIIGNKPASGTAILDELGEEHMKTGALIVYTSADSVLQIAAHEEIVPLDELYKICKIARELTLMKNIWLDVLLHDHSWANPVTLKRTAQPS